MALALASKSEVKDGGDNKSKIICGKDFLIVPFSFVQQKRYQPELFYYGIIANNYKLYDVETLDIEHRIIANNSDVPYIFEVEVNRIRINITDNVSIDMSNGKWQSEQDGIKELKKLEKYHTPMVYGLKVKDKDTVWITNISPRLCICGCKVLNQDNNKYQGFCDFSKPILCKNTKFLHIIFCEFCG